MSAPHLYTGSCQDCGCSVKRPLLICAKALGYENGCLERRQETHRATTETLEQMASRHAEEFSAAVVETFGGSGVDIIMVLRHPDNGQLQVLRALPAHLMVEVCEYLADEYRNRG